MVRSAQDCREHARWVEEEIPSRLGRDHASQLGKHREERKQERFEVGQLPLTLSQPFFEWLVRKALLSLSLGEPSVLLAPLS